MRQFHLPLCTVWLALTGLSGFEGCGARAIASLQPRGLTGAVVHVSERGSDAADGEAESPVRSIGRALKVLGDGGGTVELAPGDYPMFEDRVRRSAPVLVRGVSGDVRRPRRALPSRINGARLAGSSRLTFQSLAFDGPVEVTNLPTDRRALAQYLRFDRVEMTAPGSRCLMIRGGEDIEVDRSWIHDCANGIGGYGRPEQRSKRLSFTENLLERFVVDAMAFGFWDRVTIARNTIRDMNDPRKTAHNDGIQLFGPGSQIRIERNRITDSRSQLLLIQGDLGDLDNIEVVNNVMDNAGGIGLQAGKRSTKLKIINNTMGRSRFGALRLRSPGARRRPTIELVNNIIAGFGVLDNAAPTVQRNNLIIGGSGLLAPTDFRSRKDLFVAASRGDYRLRPKSLARGRGSRRYAPERDFSGARRSARPSIGAYE